MTKAQLVARLAADTGLSRAEARRVVDALFDPKKGLIARALASGESVRLPPLGTFSVSRRAERRGRNPRTGAAIRLPRFPSVRFQASSRLSEVAPSARPAAAKRKASSARRMKAARSVRPAAAKRKASSGTTPKPAPTAALSPTSPPPASPQTSGGLETLLLGGEAPGDVVFTAYHPKEITPRTWYTLLAYAHLPEALREVQNDSQTRLGSAAGDYGRGKGTATAVVKRGAEIVVVPELAGCRFNPTRASFIWLKDWHRTEFEVQATPEQTDFSEGHAVNGRIAFYVGPVLVGEVKIWAHISETGHELEPGAPTESVTGETYRKIFVSYAHEDAKVVDALERAYEALGDTYLRDVRTLRSGATWNRALLRMIEEADIFQLCWSIAAKRSPYVRDEWLHALQQRRPSFMRPMYWEKPIAELPPELADLHFAYLTMD